MSSFDIVNFVGQNFYIMFRISFTLIATFLFSFSTIAQDCYWQQEVDYKMEIDVDVEKNQFRGNQKLTYVNHSSDTLHRVFYHLFFNAFQPNSMMDVRSRTIEDPDGRIGSRLESLKEDEIGYQQIVSLAQDGIKLDYTVSGTILEVQLAKPILPNSKTVFEMDFEAQVPVQIRRSGRDNKEGIRYSMTQWYPKMVEYDHEGWHANPYIGREFHGVWGDFDIQITIDKSYKIAATGELESSEELKGNVKKWHFKADNTHDFAWAADPDYTHLESALENGTKLHFYFQKDSTTKYWDSLPEYTVQIFNIMNHYFGEYPYSQYTVAQGGDGGMEYPMITLITGNRSKGSLVGVTAHEAIHSWYQHILATNEAQYPWMDEGFTSYATDFVMDSLWPSFTPFKRSYQSYFSLIESGKQEPLTTHADWYHTNRAYGVASYSMGLIFLHQLSYIVGKPVFMKAMKRYFHEWKFKHPTPNDFIRVVEKESNMELSWYLEQWMESTNTIDYAIDQVVDLKGKTKVTLNRIGSMPMPVDLKIELNDGSIHWVNIPLRIMRGQKSQDEGMKDIKTEADWPWTFPKYELSLDISLKDIKSIEIDPSERMVDTYRDNNVYPFPKETNVTFKK